MADIQTSATESSNTDFDAKFSEAKSFLLTASGKSGDNMYDFKNISNKIVYNI